MPVFKLCMKIIKKNLPVMLIYVLVYLIILITISVSSTNDQKKIITQKTNIAFINEESTPLIDGLREQLSEFANFVDIPDNTEALQDALYFRSVEYIVRVPKGFTEGFMQGRAVELKKTVVPNSISNTYIDLCINQYLNTGRLYVSQMSEISQEALVQHLKSDFKEKTAQEFQGGSNAVDHTFSQYYFNYLSYSLLFVLLHGIGTIMLVFNDEDIRKRNSCAPINPGSINIQFILSNLIFAIIAWFIMTSTCLLIDIKNSISFNSLLFLLNSLIFTICGTSLSFLIGTLIKSYDAISAVSNVVALGSSFLCGVFVPQELLGESVLKIASFTPTYWYVKANTLISKMTQFSGSPINTAINYMLIQLGFAVMFIAISLAVGKKRGLQYQN